MSAIFLVWACSSPPPESRGDTAEIADRVRRLGSILDYVAADYPGCVARGQITSELEFAEQQAFMKDARDLLKSLPPRKSSPDLKKRLETLSRDVDVLADAGKVSAEARALGKEVLLTYGIVVAPTAQPNFERGALLYRENCVLCHGQTGKGDGPRTKQKPPMKVPPRSFHDPEVMAAMSPVRAYNAITDGIADTDMAKWDLLSSNDRWNLAFFVMTLRHPAAPVNPPVPLPTLGRLARATDVELDPTQGVTLAYLRRVAPYQGDRSLADTHALLNESLDLYKKKQPVAAREKVASAYLDGFEPHEAALATDQVMAIEKHFLELRAAMSQNAPVVEVEQRVLGLQQALEVAAPSQVSAGFAFFTSAAIVIREGMEGALLILLLLGAVKQAGGGMRERRAVHQGWLAALGAGVLCWFLADHLVSGIGGARREWIEGAVSILAAVVLFLVSHFVLAQADARRRVQAIRERLADALRSARHPIWLSSVAFIAVFREAFETVLFLQALMLDAGGGGAVVAAGALTGMGLLIGVVYALVRLGRRLQPGRVLNVLGGLMCVLSIVMIGKGVRSLQEAGVVSQTALGSLRIDSLGIFPTVETILAQAVMAIAFAVLAYHAIRKRA
jgi:high-affinity iron transporter